MTFVLFGPTLATRAALLDTDILVVGDIAADATGATGVKVPASAIIKRDGQATSLGNATGAQFTLLGNKDSGGAAGPAMIQSVNRITSFGVGTSWAAGANGGTFTRRFAFDASNSYFSCDGLTGDAPNAAGGRVIQSNGNQKVRVSADALPAYQFYSPTGGTASPVGSIIVGGTSTSYNTSSDYRLKYDIEDLTESGAFIDALRPRKGKWKNDNSEFVGFLAHEFAEVSSSSVDGVKDATEIRETVDEATGKTTSETVAIMQSMQASSPEVMANVIAELQSIRARLAALEGP
jgi:hypothetical protein